MTQNRTGLTLGQTKAFSGIQMGLSSLSNYMAYKGFKSQSNIVAKNAVERAEYQGKQISKLMGQQTLTYLKNGIGISGSALEVIENTGREGVKAISQDLDNTSSQIKNSMRNLKSQMIANITGSMAQSGLDIYQAYKNEQI